MLSLVIDCRVVTDKRSYVEGVDQVASLDIGRNPQPCVGYPASFFGRVAATGSKRFEDTRAVLGGFCGGRALRVSVWVSCGHWSNGRRAHVPPVRPLTSLPSTSPAFPSLQKKLKRRATLLRRRPPPCAARWRVTRWCSLAIVWRSRHARRPRASCCGAAAAAGCLRPPRRTPTRRG